MKQVVIQPSSNKEAQQHYRDNIEARVDLTLHQDVLGKDYDELMRFYPEGKAALWGVAPSGYNGTRYARMQVGDQVVFTRKKWFISTGFVTYKFKNEELAARLWGRDSQRRAWAYMYALAGMHPCRISYEDFNRVASFKPNHNHLYYNVCQIPHSQRLLAAFELDRDQQEVVSPPARRVRDEIEVRKAIEDLARNGETERDVMATCRLEQDLLRKNLGILKGGSAECSLCGRTFNSDLLVAAHIKRRAACSMEQRLDIPAVGMLACKLGCDALFEAGYITVESDGSILVSSLAENDDELSHSLELLRGRVSSAHTPEREPYFIWHRDNTFLGQPQTSGT